MKIHSRYSPLTKMLTGIRGFDEITDGGLPRGRTTLVVGGPGCGKTIFALQALVNGARTGRERPGTERRRSRCRARMMPSRSS